MIDWQSIEIYNSLNLIKIKMLKTKPTPEMTIREAIVYESIVASDNISQSSLSFVLFGFVDGTTKRDIRKIIRDLRIKHSLPIISSPFGYRVAKDEADLIKYCEELENKAKIMAYSYYKTYRAMKGQIKTKQTFFKWLFK